MSSYNNAGTSKKMKLAVEKICASANSWSTTEFEETIKYQHAWSISDFKKMMEKENGVGIRSTDFSIEINHDRIELWSLELYPNGNKEEDTGSVSLFLHLETESETSLNTDAVLSILDGQGQKKISKK